MNHCDKRRSHESRFALGKHLFRATDGVLRNGAGEDLDRVAVLRAAQRTLDEGSPGSVVHFLFTCRVCGTWCTFEKPNVLFERGQCFACGRVTEVSSAGFLMVGMPLMEGGVDE
jgi:hypothetical protein